MIKISTTQLWVHDQDEALAFYTKKLGWEVRTDVTLPEMGDFRWLTVAPAGQPDIEVVLMAIPGPPVMDTETAEQVRGLMSKGFAGTVFLTTDDIKSSCRKEGSHTSRPTADVSDQAERETLKHRAVELLVCEQLHVVVRVDAQRVVERVGGWAGMPDRRRDADYRRPANPAPLGRHGGARQDRARD